LRIANGAHLERRGRLIKAQRRELLPQVQTNCSAQDSMEQVAHALLIARASLHALRRILPRLLHLPRALLEVLLRVGGRGKFAKVVARDPRAAPHLLVLERLNSLLPRR